MIIDSSDINKFNIQHIARLELGFTLLKVQLGKVKYDNVLARLQEFRMVIPSRRVVNGTHWTQKSQGNGEPRTLQEGIEDIGLIHALNRSSGSVSLNVLESNFENYSIQLLAHKLGLTIDMVDFSLVENHSGQNFSYSISASNGENKQIAKQETQCIIDGINKGTELGSKSLMIWLSNESPYVNYKTFQVTLEKLNEIYSALPDDWRIVIGYDLSQSKYYSSNGGDMGQCLLYSMKLGDKAFALINVDSHLSNTGLEQIISFNASVEQIVSVSLIRKLAGVHFNHGKDTHHSLVEGSVNPYRLFLIFNELVDRVPENSQDAETGLKWLIGSVGNGTKGSVESLLQAVEAITIAYARALIVDRDRLRKAKESNDIAMVQEILQAAFLTDVRPVIAEARLRKGGALDPMEFFRTNKLRDKLIMERSDKSIYN